MPRMALGGRGRGGGVGHHLDPARLPPPPDADLGLHHRRVPVGLGRLHHLLDRAGHGAAGHGDSGRGQHPLALVLEEIHELGTDPGGAHRTHTRSVAPRPVQRTPRGTTVVLTGIAGVLGGILVFAIVANLVGSGADKADSAAATFDVGPAEERARTIARGGPILFQDLLNRSRDIYVQHLGDDDWRAFEAHAPGAPRRCFLEWRAADQGVRRRLRRPHLPLRRHRPRLLPRPRRRTRARDHRPPPTGTHHDHHLHDHARAQHDIVHHHSSDHRGPARSLICPGWRPLTFGEDSAGEPPERSL